MPEPKIEIQDIDHVLIDGVFVGDMGRAWAGLANTPGAHSVLGRAIREWHQRNEAKHLDDRKTRGEKHAAEVAQLRQQHVDATQQAEAERAMAAGTLRAEAESQRKAHEEWQAQQDAARKKLQADHEATLAELARDHARTVESLHVDIEVAREAYKQLRAAAKELGDTPAVLEMARQAERERLTARLAALGEAAPDGAARAMAAPAFAGLYRATDGRMAKVIRQSDRGPVVIFYWPIDDVAHADSPIGKRMQRMTLTAWREAGFEPYTPEEQS